MIYKEIRDCDKVTLYLHNVIVEQHKQESTHKNIMTIITPLVDSEHINTEIIKAC